MNKNNNSIDNNFKDLNQVCRCSSNNIYKINNNNKMNKKLQKIYFKTKVQ